MCIVYMYLHIKWRQPLGYRNQENALGPGQNDLIPFESHVRTPYSSSCLGKNQQALHSGGATHPRSIILMPSMPQLTEINLLKRPIPGSQNLGAISGCLTFGAGGGSPKAFKQWLSGSEALGMYDLKGFSMRSKV